MHDAADPIDTPKPKNLGPGINVGYVGSLYYEGRGIDIILEIAKERLDINFHLVGGNKEELDYIISELHPDYYQDYKYPDEA